MDDKTGIPMSDQGAARKFADEATRKLAEAPSQTDDFKASLQEATEELAAQAAALKEFWETWMPGGLRKRKRFRTKGHGLRRSIRRRRNRVARASRKRNRPHKKRRR